MTLANSMPFALKLLFSNILIISCVLLGKKYPSLSGLIAAMPLTTLIVLVWLYSDSMGDAKVVTTFVEGVFWGIFPTMIFFAAAWFCLRRGIPFVSTIGISFSVWLFAAIVHQVALK